MYIEILERTPPIPSRASLDSGLLEFFCLSPPFFLINFFRIPTYLHYFYLNRPSSLSAAAIAVLLPVHLFPNQRLVSLESCICVCVCCYMYIAYPAWTDSWWLFARLRALAGCGVRSGPLTCGLWLRRLAVSASMFG